MANYWLSSAKYRNTWKLYTRFMFIKRFVCIPIYISVKKERHIKLVWPGDASFRQWTGRQTACATTLASYMCHGVSNHRELEGLLYMLRQYEAPHHYLTGELAVDSPHKWPVMRRTFPFHGDNMVSTTRRAVLHHNRGKSSNGIHLYDTAWISDLQFLNLFPKFIMVLCHLLCKEVIIIPRG